MFIVFFDSTISICFVYFLISSFLGEFTILSFITQNTVSIIILSLLDNFNIWNSYGQLLLFYLYNCLFLLLSHVHGYFCMCVILFVKLIVEVTLVRGLYYYLLPEGILYLLWPCDWENSNPQFYSSNFWEDPSPRDYFF